MNLFINASKKSLRLFLSALILCTLAACGGGNDVASGGASTIITPTTNAETATTTTSSADVKPSQTDNQAVAAPIGKMEIGKIYCVTCSSCHVPETVNLSFCPHRTN